tara:strand:+ start:513 stop:698 length:186 start_codon:yes stop_codon:yes gene_type:complete
MTQTTSLDAWARSGGAIAGMTEGAVVTDESLQAAGPTRGFCYGIDVAVNAAARSTSTICHY